MIKTLSKQSTKLQKLVPRDFQKTLKIECCFMNEKVKSLVSGKIFFVHYFVFCMLSCLEPQSLLSAGTVPRYTVLYSINRY